jgi:hypothetical protein
MDVDGCGWMDVDGCGWMHGWMDVDGWINGWSLFCTSSGV